jgi:hypothetical protein
MARGNKIIVIAPDHPKGVQMEGIIGVGQTPKPGTIMQKDTSVALIGGRHTYVPYNADADGGNPKGALWILLEDRFRGDRTELSAYAAGDRCFLYCPLAGEEFNMIVADVSGTANITAGTMLMIDDTTGKLVATTGVESEPFLLLETLTAPAADQLAWVEYTGY